MALRTVVHVAEVAIGSKKELVDVEAAAIAGGSSVNHLVLVSMRYCGVLFGVVGEFLWWHNVRD